MELGDYRVTMLPDITKHVITTLIKVVINLAKVIPESGKLVLGLDEIMVELHNDVMILGTFNLELAVVRINLSSCYGIGGYYSRIKGCCRPRKSRCIDLEEVQKNL